MPKPVSTFETVLKVCKVKLIRR